MYFKRCHNLENSLVDIATINDGSTLTTLIYPLKDNIEKQIDFFKQFELSKRELEVANLMLNGHTNDAIAKGLFISKATLKTHINSIYKKVPQKYIHILKER